MWSSKYVSLWKEIMHYWVVKVTQCGRIGPGWQGRGLEKGQVALSWIMNTTTLAVSPELIHREVVTCHLQDVAKKCSIMKSYVLFFPSDIRAKVMHLEWISLHYARKIYAEQISLWDIFDARQIALLLSTALSQELMNRSCTLQQPLTQWHQNLSGLFWG